jgi:hypothetical protein
MVSFIFNVDCAGILDLGSISVRNISFRFLCQQVPLETSWWIETFSSRLSDDSWVEQKQTGT